MPVVHVPVHLTVEQLLAAVKQLSPGGLREFAEQFAAWQKQHDQQDEEEAALLIVPLFNPRRRHRSRHLPGARTSWSS